MGTAVLALGLEACFDPAPKEGILCGQGYLCPPGDSCESDGVCRSDADSADDQVHSIAASVGDTATLVDTTFGPVIVTHPGSDVLPWFLPIDFDNDVAQAGDLSSIGAVGKALNQMASAQVNQELWVVVGTDAGLVLTAYDLTNHSVTQGATLLVEEANPSARSLGAVPLSGGRLALTWEQSATKHLCIVTNDNAPSVSCIEFAVVGFDIGGIVVRDIDQVGLPAGQTTGVNGGRVDSTRIEWFDCSAPTCSPPSETDTNVLIEHTSIAMTEGAVFIAGLKDSSLQLLRIDASTNAVTDTSLDGRDAVIRGGRYPAVATDGSRVVTAWRIERESGQLDLYTRCHSADDISTGEPVRQTTRANHGAIDPSLLIWSPSRERFVAQWTDLVDGVAYKEIRCDP